MKSNFEKQFVDVDGVVCFGQMPYQNQDIRFLESKGVTTIFSMGSNDLRDVMGSIPNKHGLEVFSFNLIPSTGDLFEILAGLRLTNPKRKIFFHCDHGSRTYGNLQKYKAVLGKRSSYSGEADRIKLLKSDYVWAFCNAACRLKMPVVRKRFFSELKRVGLTASPQAVVWLNQSVVKRRIAPKGRFKLNKNHNVGRG